MAADFRLRKNQSERRRRGQSLVEFAFLMPMFIGMMVFLRDVNIAMNMGIVNKKYSRATLHFLTFNHRWYPEQNFIQQYSRNRFMHRWWVGVEDEREDMDKNNDKISPKAPTIAVGRYSKGHGSAPEDDTPGIDIQRRHKVRIRTMSFICLPPFGDKLGMQFSEGSMGEDTFHAPGFAYCSD